MHRNESSQLLLALRLALALRQLIMQPQYASLLGQQGYALVLQEFSPERHLQGMQALLNTMAPS